MKKFQVIIKTLPIYVGNNATNAIFPTSNILAGGNIIDSDAVVTKVINGQYKQMAQFNYNGIVSYVKRAGLKDISSVAQMVNPMSDFIDVNDTNIESQNIVNDINKDILNQKSETAPANKTKFAKGVFVTLVAAGVILPLIFAPKDKKIGYAILFGAFGVFVGGGISLGLSGKIKD